MQTLTLYSTSACHLCELALELIEPFVASRELKLDIVDIANDDALLERYGIRIPVIKLEGRNSDLGWPFDADSVADYLQTI